jgi:flavin reductase (DIM6/NTAB) family NADH-FMN oxidoreductase RutF
MSQDTAKSQDPAMHQDPSGISADDYRAVMRTWPSGVTIITMLDQGKPHGMTASAFTSVSIAPPLVLIVIDRRWRSHDMIREAGAFCVNILAQDQSTWSDRFAGRHGEMPDRFFDLETATAVTGAPHLVDGLGWLDCQVEAAHRAGDHTIFVGRVAAGGLGQSTDGPLVYHDGDYHRLADDASDLP